MVNIYTLIFYNESLFHKIVGAKLHDEISGKEFNVRAKCVINATGPFTDQIRKMDDQKVSDICCPSSGVHIVLPGYYRFRSI